MTDIGVMNALRLVLRLSCATLPLAIMLSATKLGDLSNALVEKLHIPFKYAFTMTTAIRFIPVFAAEMAGIMEAQVSRGIELDTKNPFRKLRWFFHCAPLFWFLQLEKHKALPLQPILGVLNSERREAALKNMIIHWPMHCAMFSA